MSLTEAILTELGGIRGLEAGSNRVREDYVEAVAGAGPTNLQAAVASATSTTLTWNAVSGATGYVVQVREHKAKAATYTDEFDYANGTNLASTAGWEPDWGTLIVNDGAITAQTVQDDSVLVAAQPATVDGYVEMTFQTAGNNYTGVIMRNQGSDPRRELVGEMTPEGHLQIIEIWYETSGYNPAYYHIVEQTGDIYTAGAGPMKIRLEAIGNFARMYVDDVLTLRGYLSYNLAGTRARTGGWRNTTFSIFRFEMGTLDVGAWLPHSTPTGTTATVTGLIQGAQYDYRVAATVGTQSDWSATKAHVTGLGAPTITAVTPATSDVGTKVTVTGTNFATDSTTVTFDGVGEIPVQSRTFTTLDFIVPEHVNGPTALRVVTPNGVSSPSTFTFTGASGMLVADDFNRADVSPVDAPWTNRSSGLAAISGNQLVFPTTNLDSLYQHSVQTELHGYVQANMRQDNGYMGLQTQINAPFRTEVSIVFYPDGTVHLESYPGGGQMATAWSGYVAGSTVLARLEWDITPGVTADYRVYIDGVLRLSATSTTRTAGTYGVGTGAYRQGGVTVIDNFEMGKLPEVVLVPDLWYDASEAGALVMSGANISGVNAKSGVGPNLTAQFSGGTSIGTRNGHATIDIVSGSFDGYMGTTTAHTGNSVTMIAACNFQAGNQFGRLFSLSKTGDTDWGALSGVVFGGLESGGTRWPCVNRAGTVLSDGFYTGWHVVRQSVEGANIYIYVDGVLRGSGTTTDAAFGFTNIGLLGVGGGAGNNSFRGQFGEGRTYNKALSAGQIEIIEDELTAKWVTLPAALYTDYFNRADGALTTPWVVVGGTMAVVSNQAAATAANAASLARYNQTLADDQWAEADITVFPGVGSGNSMGPAVRVNAGGGAVYYANYDKDTQNLDVWRIDGSSNYARVVAVYSTVGLNGVFKCRVEAQGTTIRLYVNGTLVGTGTDSTVASGQAGLMGAVYGTVPTKPSADNFRCGDLPYTPIIPRSGSATATYSAAATAVGSAPVLVYSDNFNRANGAAGALWIPVINTGHTIVSNRLTSPNQLVEYMDRFATAMPSANHEAQATLTVGQLKAASGIMCRMGVGTPTGYQLQMLGSDWSGGGGTWKVRLVRNDPGPSEIEIAPPVAMGTDNNVAHTFKIRAVGTTISGYVDGVKVIEAADNTYTTQTGVGVRSFWDAASPAYWDDFTAGAAAASNFLQVRRLAGGTVGVNYADSDYIRVALGEMVGTVVRPYTWVLYSRILETLSGDGTSLIQKGSPNATIDFYYYGHALANNDGAGTEHFVPGMTDPPINKYTIHAFTVSATGVIRTSRWIEGTGWTHTTPTGTSGFASNSWPATGTLDFYSYGADADYVCAAAWGSVLTTTQLETLTAGWDNWLALSPTHRWRFDETPPNDAVGAMDWVSGVGTTLPGVDSPLPLVAPGIKLRQAKAGNQGSTVAFDTPVLAGSLIVVSVSTWRYGNPITSVVTDTRGNTYIPFTGFAHPSSGDLVTRTSYAMNAIAGATTVSTAQGGDYTTYIAEFTGVATTDAVRIAHSATGGSGTTAAAPATGALTVGDLVYAFMSHQGGTQTLTEDIADGFSLVCENEAGDSANAGGAQYKVATATTTLVANWTKADTNNWTAERVVFKKAP